MNQNLILENESKCKPSFDTLFLDQFPFIFFLRKGNEKALEETSSLILSSILADEFNG